MNKPDQALHVGVIKNPNDGTPDYSRALKMHTEADYQQDVRGIMVGFADLTDALNSIISNPYSTVPRLAASMEKIRTFKNVVSSISTIEKSALSQKIKTFSSLINEAVEAMKEAQRGERQGIIVPQIFSEIMDILQIQIPDLLKKIEQLPVNNQD